MAGNKVGNMTHSEVGAPFTTSLSALLDENLPSSGTKNEVKSFCNEITKLKNENRC